jgi:hypothetical protein
VERAFEPNRLAEDLQARAYEQVVPVVVGSLAARRRKVEDADAPEETLQAKGVAA